MEFWGAKVEPKRDFDGDVSEGEQVHITQASLDFEGDKKDRADLFVSVGGRTKYFIGSLSQENTCHMKLDLIFEEKFVLSHTLNSGSVHFTGYTTPSVKSLVTDQGTSGTSQK
ncbi:hypothetical protein AALP_AA8G492500 [Arabis alpina]|uniref:Nucleoplasmin-like domain-containing protein n=1 Tax=Arabis alpina TaxID=50452 RepID=A0A087GEF1_ARAAL|nr:hypothetical protein AALP_AA8G492500 [Arabis alpina]